MNKKIIYTPILKAKEGEFLGLRSTDFEILNQMLPLFEIPNITWDYEKSIEKKSIDKHISDISNHLERSIGQRDFFIHSNYLDENRITENGDHHLTHLFKLFNSSNLNGIPVITFHNATNFHYAVKYINENYNTGICIRINQEDIEIGGLNERLSTLLNNYSLEPHKVSLVFDLKDISDTDENLYDTTIESILNLEHYNDWKYITIVSTSMLKDLGSVGANSNINIKRLEWLLYTEKLTEHSERVKFGDYSCFFPEITELNPRFIQMSAHIKYTCENYWRIERGTSTKLNGNAQYRELSSKIVEFEQFQGSGFSWGDNKIFECANNTGTTGNASTWRQVMNCHHFTYVINQLSN